MPADITKYGTKGLKGLNRQLPTREELNSSLRSTLTGTQGPSLSDDTSLKSYDIDSPMGSLGTSQYDASITFQPMTDDTLLDTRYENQSGLDVLANGVGKALGTAATTFLSSLVGLPAGIATAIGEQRWSGLWDNDVTNKLGDVDDWLESNMTNYKSRAQEENKWWQNLGTMNFWADDVIKNAGFTLGAAASMAVGAGSLGLLSKSLGFVNNISKGAKMAGAGVSALFSATGEGMIEARNGVEERNKLEMQRLEDALAPERNAIELEKQLIDQEYQQTGDYDTYRRNMTATLAKERDLNNRLENGRQEIEESGKLMGNKILLGNQVLLSAGNLIQFGKSIYKSFDRARHVAETASKLGKPFGVTAQRVSNEIKDGFKVVGKNFGRAAVGVKGFLTEGSEEMNQQWIQNTSGLLEQRKDANDYWKAKLDPDAMKDSSEGMYTLGQAIAKGFDDSWGDIDQWEQFFIGGITGLAGTYMPTKLFNQDKTKARWDPRRYGEWSGGAYNEITEFNRQYNQFNENVNDLNSILSKEDFFERARDFVGHTYTETKKNEALENGDKKTWKDEDDKQIIHDIQAFYRAGKIDDLRAIYDEMGKNLSDDDVQNIIKSSTRETTNEEGKTKYIGAFVDENGNQIVSNDQIREEVKHNSEKLNEKLDSYLDSVLAVLEDTGGRLTKDLEDNLAYLHNLGKESNKRFLDTISKRRKDMPQKFLFKTNKTPEQLTEEYVTSDLTFEKNTNTPEGYVEANTSLMTDSAFANFFMREIMWGGNISPDFGKTVDEKDTEDKNLSEEEKKKRAMERFTAKLKEVEEKQKKELEDQQVANIKRMKKEFIDNYRQNNDATVDEALSAWNELKQDVIDASDLLNQAGQYRLTLSEYLANPQKVDEDKKKEEDKAEKKAEKELVKGMSVRDLSNRDDLDSLLTLAQEEKDIDLINKIKRAKVLREKRAGLDAVESDTESYKDLDPSDADAAFLILRKQVEDDIDDPSDTSDVELEISELVDKVADVDEGNISDHVDRHAIVNINPKTGLKTLALKKDEINAAEEAQVVQFMNENPEEYERLRNILIDRIHNSIKSIDDRLNKMLSQIDTDDIDEEGTAKLKKYSNKIKEEENLPDIEPEKKKDRNAPVQTVVSKPVEVTEKKPIDGVSSEEALISDMRQSTTDGMQTPFDSGQHPWYSVSGRVGYHSNEPFSETLRKIIEDPNVSEEKKAAYRKQYDRCIAVEDFLEKNGAYTRVENGGAKKGKAKFKVFKSVNDKAKDFVIFITDGLGRVLGDLPSSDIDIDPNTEKRVGLAELYEEARKQFEEANTEEYELKGIETEIDFVYIGKPQYQEERQSVNNLFEGNTFTLAIKVADTNVDSPVAFLDTGKKSLLGKLEKDAIREPLTGTLGQPYVLIPTSLATNKNNYGRGYFAVPIATPTFGEIDKNSVFYRTVRQTLEQIRDGKLSETEAKTKLGELFGLANFHVNFESKESRKGAGISATTYIRQDGSEKGAPHTLYVGDRASMDVDAVLNELGRFFINISNSQINSSKTYTTIEGVAYTYNQMIGEIAQTNVARPHTVNDWFTIKPVEKKDGKWQVSKTPTQRIPYPSGSNNSVFNVSVPYQDGTTHIWTISPKDWIVRDELGRAIYFQDSVHSEAEANVAAILMARAFGRFYMKDMSKPYVVQVGNQARLFDPNNNTFKTAKELEETPRYRKGVSFDSLEDEYNYLLAMEDEMIEGYELAAAQKAAEEAAKKLGSTVTPQLVGQDMATHLKEMGVDVELVDDASKAAEGIEDAQLSVEESDEMEQIKKDAIADGTFMKAPNGKPTKLTERQWLQVRTKNFIRWFGDWINDPANASKVVDENGEPLVVYHNGAQFNVYDFERTGEIYNEISKRFGVNAAFFAPNKWDAYSYQRHNREWYGENDYITSAFLNIRNLAIRDYNNPQGTDEDFAKEQFKEGKDGFASILKEDDFIYEYIVFNPNQIKSATDNNGEFSNENPNINMLKVDGKILGFEYNGKLYLQKDALNPNLPMHEYTHLWDKVIKTVDPRLWNKGKKLMKSEAADLWKQIAEDENYGKRWEKEGKTTEEIEDLIASEVHARLTGKAIEDTYNKYPTGTFAKLRQWMLDVLKKLAKTLGMSDEQVNKLTLQDWTRLTLRDFMEKSITMNTIQEEAQKAINRERSEAIVEKIKEDSKNYVLTDANGKENPQGAYYKDKRNEQLHARVTSVKEGDTRVLPFNETDAEGKPNVWILPSTTIGNAVDEFVRAFFAGEDTEVSPLAQNLSEETKKHLREELEKIKTSAEKGGWKIVSNGIVASGTIMVKDANGDKMAIRVAGTLDLLLYNPEKDEYAIYDMKTHRSAVDNQKELDWAAQLSLYKQLLEIKFPELRGKIKALRIIPFSTSGYDANKQNYEKDSEGRLTSNGEIVKVNVKYDGKIIDLTDKEMNLDISFARPGFKKEYVEGEGALKIIVSKPLPKLGEAPKTRVKEGIVKTINKIEAKDSVKTFLKHSFEENKEALQLVEVLDKARKDGTLGELCFTEGTMSLLEDMLDTKKIDRIAGFAALDKKGINVQEELPDVEAQEEDVDTIAENKGILNSSTKNAWNKLTPENKEKIVKLKRGLNSVKKELKECQKLGKDPNSVIGGYLHRKANETSGYTVIDMEKELAWLNRVLPKLSRENKLKIVEGLIKCSDGTWDYGQIKQGLIYIASNGKEGTVYHEAFHAVTQWILTDMELNSLYKAAKERYGNLDTVTLEEKLADDFMRYTMGFEPSYKRNDLNILQKLWQVIKSIFKNTSIIDQLYRDINDGVYADRVLRTENNEFAHIDNSDRQVSMKYNFLDSELKQILKAGNVSQQQYEVLDTDEKKYLFHCVL